MNYRPEDAYVFEHVHCPLCGLKIVWLGVHMTVNNSQWKDKGWLLVHPDKKPHDA